MRRVARLGDGWMPNFQADAFGAERIEKLRALVREQGRDPAAIGIEATVTIIDRTPEQLGDELRRWREIGATHATLNTMPERWVADQGRWNKVAIGPLESPEAHTEAIRRARTDLSEFF